MKLLDKQGNATATIISQTALDETDTVYNFEVHFHTYRIGELVFGLIMQVAVSSSQNTSWMLDKKFYV